MILGIDLGRKRHFTVIIGIDEVEDVIHVKLVKSMQGVPFDEQVATIKSIMSLHPVTKVNIDAGGIGMPIAEDLQQKYRNMINPMMFTNELKQEMMVNLRMLFEHKKIRIPNHRQLVSSLHKIQRKRTPSGLERFEAEEDETGEHGDFAWALAMACYGKQKPVDFGFYAIKR